MQYVPLCSPLQNKHFTFHVFPGTSRKERLRIALPTTSLLMEQNCTVVLTAILPLHRHGWNWRNVGLNKLRCHLVGQRVEVSSMGEDQRIRRRFQTVPTYGTDQSRARSESPRKRLERALIGYNTSVTAQELFLEQDWPNGKWSSRVNSLLARTIS